MKRFIAWSTYALGCVAFIVGGFLESPVSGFVAMGFVSFVTALIVGTLS